MNKKLMVLAVAGAFAAPALVHAQASTVNIYGRMNVHFGNYKSSGTGGLPSRNAVNNHGGTSIGFRGEEKLGGGLSGIFQVESNVTGDGTGGANTFGSRNTGVGLKGGFGTVILGSWDTPYKQVIAALSQTGLTGPAGVTTIIGNGNETTNAPGGTPAATNQPEFSFRAKNAVYYTTPSWNGFQAKALYQANEAKTTTPAATARDASLWSVSASYSAGPLAIMAAFDRHDEFSALNTTDDGWIVGANYTFAGTTKVGVAFERLEYEPTTTTTLKRNAWLLNASHRMGPHTIIGTYMRAGDTKGNAVVASGKFNGLNTPALGQTGATGFSLMYRYGFSKRTSLVATYGQVKNETNATYDFQGGGNPILGAAGSDPKAYTIGIDHRY